MKTYIFTRKLYQRDQKGYYTMIDSVIVNVFASKDKAIMEAQKDLDEFHHNYGGIETIHSQFSNEVFNHTLKVNQYKLTSIVTENNVID